MSKDESNSIRGLSRDKRVLMPRVRFPDFLAQADWIRTQIGQVSTLHKGKGISKADVVANGVLPCIRYGELYTVYEENIHTVYSRTNVNPDGLFLSQKNDVIIPASGETAIDIAKASCVLQDGVALGGDLNVIRSSLHGTFLSYYLNGPLKSSIAEVAQGDAIVHLYPSQIAAINISLPHLEEQRKIADCLTSLDERIIAETQRHDTLKTHKLGLMRQLFPRDGEAVPRLRFANSGPEGGWSEHPVSRMLKDALRPVKMDDDESYILVTVKRRYGGIVLRETLEGRQILVKSQFKIRSGDFLISKRQIVHCACGVVPEEYDGSIVSNEYSIYQPREDCDIGFFNYFSQQPRVGRSFLECSVGIVIEKMLFKQELWLKTKFRFPSLQEQQRISSCMSSLDELITALSQKIDALRRHKKGLLQQLFPMLDAVQP